MLTLLLAAIASSGGPQHEVAVSPISPVPGVLESVTPTSTTLLAASLKAKLDGPQYQVVFRPGELFPDTYRWWLSEAKITATANTDTNLTELTVGTGYNPFALRGDRAVTALKDVAAMCTKHAEALIHAKESKNDDAIREATEAMEQCVARQFAAQMELVNVSAIPGIQVSGILDLFPAGQAPSESNPAVSADKEPFGGVGAELRLSFRPSLRTAIDPYLQWKHGRPTGAPGTKLSNTVGGGLTASFLAFRLYDPGDLGSSRDFIATGFLPGFAFGVSAQAKHCDGGAACDKGRTTEISATPFLEARVSPELTVQLAFKVSRYESTLKDGTEASPALTLTTAFGGK